jgi:DNA-binding Lrp family transcriptional regulator
MLTVGGFSMVMGLTMIKVRPGCERAVYAGLQKRPEVIDIYRLFGEYNFFLVIQAVGKSRVEQVLREIEDEKVIETGPVLLTAESDPMIVPSAVAEYAAIAG